MKSFLLTACALLAAGSAFAQNSAYYKADVLFNEEQKTKEAAEAIEPALTNPKTTKLAAAYNLAGNIFGKMLSVEIEKASKREPIDTLLFISSLNKAVTYFTKSHEYDVAPNSKGKIKPEFVANNKKMIGQMLDYYAYAAGFQNARKDIDGAYNSFEKAINMPKNPVFSKEETDSIYAKKNDDYSKWSYFAAMLAYGKKDWDGVLNNIELALKNPESMEDGYTMKLAALQQKKDMPAWIECSKDAIKNIQGTVSFCQNLLNYYTENNLAKEAQATADEITKAAPNSKMAYYAQGCVYLNTVKDFAKARTAFEKSIQIDPSFLQANFNMGVSYINEIVSKKDEFCTDPRKPEFKKDKQKILEYYRKAKPYFEKVRELTPNSPANWGSYLKNVYYNLEMKDKEKEIDEAMK